MSTKAENDASGAPLVLVADDDPDILRLVSLHLSKAGYAVATASDGREALSLAREKKPDAAIVDVRMPEMDGLEVIRQIRADDGISDILVVALSARVKESNIAEGFDAGADEYMEKPFSGRQLLDLVESKLA
jgi:two-component system, OmpR family, alkaline phosphatase synthesis response regulator PhoP